ncbi:MAG: hypothetical protein ACE5R6_04155 [Candidatus Heimdallarchaeota archaeon]
MEINVAQNKNQKAYYSSKSEITYNIKPGLAELINRTIIDLSKSIDLTTLRILGILFNKQGHTKAQITETLQMWEEQIDEKLKGLKEQGFICDKRMTFGIDIFGGRRTIRVYYITELGRFLLHHLDMQFPGLWMTTSKKEVKTCEYSK